jgi:Ca-activated chloride channel family protein
MMDIRRHRGIALFVLMIVLATLACSLPGSDGEDAPPRDAAVLEIIANDSLEPWLAQVVDGFNQAEITNAEEKQVFVILNTAESGQAVTQLSENSDSYGLWIPDEQVWINVLADQGNDDFQGDCLSIAQSPLVIGMWRPAAESLGWPGLPLGWLDIGSLAADPSAWGYYSGGEFGDALRLSHTHPGLSGTGTSTLLALVQAAQSKADAVTVEDIQQPIVQASVGAFEGAVTWFSNSTDGLGLTMYNRGVTYLGAAVMYESTVAQHGNGEIVPIYPLEGTFVATHPACVNGSADETMREAARIFRDHLTSEEGQQAALSYGLRPVSSAVPLGPPLDPSNGIDTSQPQIIFNAPSVDAVYAVQELWQAARKDVNLVMLLDTSGSMGGSKIEGMKEAAVQFVEQMGDDDFISVIAFATEPTLLVNHIRLGENRNKIINAIANLEADGDTTLFDAIGDGGLVIAQTTSIDTTNAMVVLTDGQDTQSYRYAFNQGLIDHVTANGTTVFTIAYGNDADEDVLSSLAFSANGNFYRGDEASITAIYDEMSAAFGGSVGVGR